MLLPRSCVTEVVNYQAPTPMEGAPPWYLGTIAWGGRRVPLVSFEAICGRTPPRTTGRTRIVIIQGITAHTSGGHFAVLTQGFPATGQAQRRCRPCRMIRARLPNTAR